MPGAFADAQLAEFVAQPSPAFAELDVAAMREGIAPSALIVSAEHDPLREDSEAFAGRLRDAGVDVQLRCEPGLIHNFMQLDEISPACAAAAAADRVAADLRTRLGAGGAHAGCS